MIMINDRPQVGRDLSAIGMMTYRAADTKQQTVSTTHCLEEKHS
jgi:hypothetical protein